MATTKITKREMFTMIMDEVQDNKEMVSFLEHEIELLNRKARRSGETKTQKENKVIMENILVALGEIDRPIIVSDLMKENSEIGQYPIQKVSALLKKLVESDKVQRVVEKKKPYYSLI